ncbi:metal-binding protein [Clostridiaceae bacterium UIB06]|uniref:Metal-binding protein n=1 Tax=Clostridium thailandense TaxID=2794346 RepID=A0A949X3P1_9CLOT|nr:metal-binding protein [Clostridium thailandense]MBV7272703.1 metal-binding protein [Clostridium thailandense]MCH5135869.1 metal-binding protein [Clostridiaceae bacterium UIB06]
MTIKDIMKYIESEFSVINDTPCEICGGDYIAEDLKINVVDGVPYDICDCICSNCGYEKTFEFCAPFIDENSLKKAKNILN